MQKFQVRLGLCSEPHDDALAAEFPTKLAGHLPRMWQAGIGDNE